MPAIWTCNGNRVNNPLTGVAHGGNEARAATVYRRGGRGAGVPGARRLRGGRKRRRAGDGAGASADREARGGESRRRDGRAWYRSGARPPWPRDDFRQALAQQFASHEIVAAEPKKAHYLLRVYLSAAPAEGGANLEYVVDVYDSRRQRAARLETASASAARATPGA